MENSKKLSENFGNEVKMCKKKPGNTKRIIEKFIKSDENQKKTLPRGLNLPHLHAMPPQVSRIFSVFEAFYEFLMILFEFLNFLNTFFSFFRQFLVIFSYYFHFYYIEKLTNSNLIASPHKFKLYSSPNNLAPHDFVTLPNLKEFF